eukprot:12818260-Alexandrium_andersonii.AAC.1
MNLRGLELAEGGYCGALCEMRADLLEFVGALGFKAWPNEAHPCFCCNSHRDTLICLLYTSPSPRD